MPGQHLRLLIFLLISFTLVACDSGGGDKDDDDTSGTPTTIVATGSAGTGGSISPPSVSASEGENAEFTVTPDTGFVIDSVTGCNGSLNGNLYTTGALTADCSVTASFSAISYLVNTSAGANGSISPSSANVTHGSDTSFTVTPDANFRINTVEGCSGTLTGSTYTTGPITAECTVTATFVADTGATTHTVSSSAGAGGNISPDSIVVDENSTVEFTVTADAGYDIDTVSGCGGSLAGNVYTTGPITGACTVSASFVIQTFNVDATAGAGGSISPPSQTVDYGSSADFTLTPDTGYDIESVTGCGGSLNGNVYTTGAVTSGCTVSASFSIQTFSVNAAAGTGGSILPGAQSVDYGATANFTVTPDSGYGIDTVTGCGGSLAGNSYTTGAITASCTVSATFLLLPDPAINLTPGILSFSENGGGSTLDFVLNTAPDGTVIIDLALTDSSVASLSTSQLTFDVSNWSVVQTVLIDGIDNAIANGNQTSAVTASVNGSSTDTTGYTALVIPSTTYTIIDEDAAGFTVTPGTVTFSEAGGSGNFDIVLNSEPTADVTINVTSNNTLEATVDNSSVTFTPGDWDIPQPINLTAVNDDVADGNQTVAIDFVISLPTADTTGYASVANQSHDVTVTDDDVAGVTVSPLAVSVTEGGANTSFTVQLNTQPDGTVLINTTSSNTDAATINTTQLSFDAGNWSTEQTVIVSAVEDGVTDPGQTLTVILETDAASSDTTGYSSIDPEDVSVTVNDPRPILLYSAGLSNGNLGGRSGADSICANAMPAACGTRTNVHAFIAAMTFNRPSETPATDTIANLASNFGLSPNVPIQSINNVVFGNNWADLMDQSIPQSLQSAGILPAGTRWWSGSNQSGGSYGVSCSGWTTSTIDGTLNSMGIVGSGVHTDFRWLMDATVSGNTTLIDDRPCNESHALLCVCGD